MNDEETKSQLEGISVDTRPVTFTAAATRKVLEFAEAHEQAHGRPLRLYVQGSRTGYDYGFTFEEKGEIDELIRQEEFDLVVDGYSLQLVEGSTVDYVESLTGGGFVVNNPNEPDPMGDPLFARVQRLIDEQINPGVAMHGGFVSLLDIKDGVAYVQLGGGCQGCGMVDVTLKQGIERMLKEQIPEIQSVYDTTDHASGQNPFYQPSKGSGF
ncbi:MAG: NifU family protein [Acidobacteriota bacterium]